jgi:hypothetical protein
MVQILVMKWIKPIYLLCVCGALASCKKESSPKQYNSNYIIDNNSNASIEVHVSLHNSDGSGTISEIDFVSVGNKLTILNSNELKNASMGLVFHDIRIFQSGQQCVVDELNNSNWSVESIGDGGLDYTFKVDSTFFQ